MNDHPESAEATYRPPAFELLKTASDVFNLEQPAPVLWREPDPGEVDGKVDAVLSVGEVAILASKGGFGKSLLTLALAVEAAIAAEDGREYGNACGLRVKAGGGVLVSYEDSPARIGNRLRWFTKTAPEGLHLWANPEPLFQTDPENRGAVTKCAAWEQLWTEIKAVRPALVIIDPVSAALADADTSQTGPARTFIRELSQEAAIADCGVLLVAHDTKSARNQAMAGQDPGAGGRRRFRGLVRRRPRRADPGAGPDHKGRTAAGRHQGELWPDRMGSAADGAVRGRPIPRPGTASADGAGRRGAVARRRREEGEARPRARGGDRCLRAARF